MALAGATFVSTSAPKVKKGIKKKAAPKSPKKTDEKEE